MMINVKKLSEHQYSIILIMLINFLIIGYETYFICLVLLRKTKCLFLDPKQIKHFL